MFNLYYCAYLLMRILIYYYVNPNGYPAHERGLLNPFIILIGIALTDQLEPLSGNLCVWPGSHLVIEDKIRALRGLTDPVAFEEDKQRLKGLLKGILNEVCLEEAPKEILLKSGDAIVMQHKVAHLGGSNDTTSTTITTSTT